MDEAIQGLTRGNVTEVKDVATARSVMDLADPQPGESALNACCKTRIYIRPASLSPSSKLLGSMRGEDNMVVDDLYGSLQHKGQERRSRRLNAECS